MEVNEDDPGLPKSWNGESIHLLKTEGPIAVIGDIHGADRLLQKLLQKLAHCQILVVGDICDRGPNTKRVIDLLLEVDAQGVLGNHDLWLAAWAAGEGFDPFALNPGMGGVATLASYGVTPDQALYDPNSHQAVPQAHRDWLLGLHVCIDLHVADQTYWVTHAGIPNDFVPPPDVPLEGLVPWLARNHPLSMQWLPNEPEQMLTVDRPIIMGHRTQAEVLVGNVIAVDTHGGQPGRPLSAIILPNEQVVSVNV